MQIIPDKIIIESMGVREFSYRTVPQSSIDQLSTYRFNVDPQLGASREESKALVSFIFRIVDEEQQTLVDAKTECLFRVENMADFISAEDGKVDSMLPTALIGIAWSTMRGMLWAVLGNTPYAKVTLPVVDPAEIFEVWRKKMVSQEEEE